MQSLINSILACSTSPQGWEKALDGFVDEFGITSGCMYSLREFEAHAANFNMSGFLRDNISQATLDILSDGSDEYETSAYLSLFRKPAQTIYEEHELIDDKKPGPVREDTESIGIKFRSAAALNTSGPWVDALFVHQSSPAERNRFFENQNVKFLLPVMASSLSLGRVLKSLQTRFSASLTALGRLGLGVFLIDETGCVIEYNKEAHRILSLQDGLSLSKDKRLRLMSPDKSAELSSLIEQAYGLFRGDATRFQTHLAADRPSGDYEYLISVQALSDTHAELENGFKCAFVTVLDPAREKVLSSEGVSLLGQLSGAEDQVVKLLIDGHRPSQVAEMRNVSMNTTKTQIKSISRKLRCSSQSDIIRVAAATRVPFEEE